MTRNLKTSLKPRRRARNPMAEFDRLPKEPRAWLAQAQLPWSATSIKRLWSKALSEHAGDANAALAYLDHCEAAKMKKDAPRVWGTSYPCDL